MGARLVIASDGVWDSFHGSSSQKLVAKLVRGTKCRVAPMKVINAVMQSSDYLRDDTSIVIVDITPPGADFAKVCALFQLIADRDL